MAELHVIGQLVGGCDFPSADLFCKWGIVAGPAWRCLEGETAGQTHVDTPMDGVMARWGHPIDVHYSTKGMQGWPKMHVEVWHQDGFGRNELYGYGFCQIPTSPGTHVLECMCWRPSGSASERASAYFVGGAPQLKSQDLVYNPTDRHRLRTDAMGKVRVKLGVVLRNFGQYGVEV